MTFSTVTFRAGTVPRVVARDANDGGLPLELRDPLADMVGGAPLRSVVPVTGGSQVQVWQVTLDTPLSERYALRRVGRPLDLLDRQALALRDLPTDEVRLATILANRPLDTAGAKPACAQLTTWLTGSHPSPGRSGDNRAIGAALAHLHQGLEGTEADFSDRPLILPSYSRYIADLTRLLDEDRPVVAGLSLNRRRVFLWEHLQESAKLPTQLLHGDLHAANIVVAPGEKPGFLDFDKMMVGPRIFDLAKYVATSLFHQTPTARLARRSVDAFLAGYTDISPLTEVEHHCLDALALLLMAETALVGINYDLPHLVTQADAIGTWWANRRHRQIRPQGRRAAQRPTPSHQLGLFPEPSAPGRVQRASGGGAAPLVIAVNYHRVGPTDPANPHHRLHAVTSEAFQAQIDLLTELGTFVALDDLRHPDDLDPVNILVTFDDVPAAAMTGIELLRQAGLPYAAAVCTGLADNGHGLRDKVYAIAHRYTDDEIHQILAPGFERLLPPRDRFRFYSFSKSDALPHQAMVDEIIDPLFATIDNADDQGHPGRPAYLDWDQIRLLAADPLATLVNHSHSHANLAALTRSEIQADIDLSTSRFADEVEGPVPTWFAVPFGHVDQRVCLDLLRALDPHRYEGVLWVGRAATIIEPRPEPTIRHLTRLTAPKSAAELRRLAGLCRQEPNQHRYLTEAITTLAHRDPVSITSGSQIDDLRPFERLVRENKPYALSSEYFDYQFTDNPSRTDRPAYQAVVRDDDIEAVLYNFHTTFQLEGHEVPGVYVAGWRKLPRAHHLASGLLLRKLVQQEAIVGVANPSQQVIGAFATWESTTTERFTLTTEPAASIVLDTVAISDHTPPDLDRLCADIHRQIQFTVRRSRQLYRWRYDTYPLAPCAYLSLRDGDETTGFGVLVQAGNQWSLSDYHAPGEGVFPLLLAAARHHAYEAGALTLTVQTSSPDDGDVLRAHTLESPQTLRNFYHFNQARLRELGVDIDPRELWPTWRLHETEVAGDVLQRPEHHVAPAPRT